MEIAQLMTRERSPETLAHDAWIPADTPEGEEYWEALQVVRRWTKGNHFAIHDTVARHLALKVKGRFWNEHNFVFLRDGLFYHAKGATPAYRGFAEDDSGLTLIPLNMAAPILIARGRDAPTGSASHRTERGATSRARLICASKPARRKRKWWRSRPGGSTCASAAFPMSRSCPAPTSRLRRCARKSTNMASRRSPTRSSRWVDHGWRLAARRAVAARPAHGFADEQGVDSGGALLYLVFC